MGRHQAGRHRPAAGDQRRLGGGQVAAGDGLHARDAGARPTTPRCACTSPSTPTGPSRGSRRGCRSAQDGEVVGWTLDLMRRRDHGFRPVMEFLIGASAMQFKEEGYQFISLSAAPLAKAPDDARRQQRPAGAAEAARLPRQHARAVLRVPVAVRLQAEVPARATTRCTSCSPTRRRWPRSASPSPGPTCPTPGSGLVDDDLGHGACRTRRRRPTMTDGSAPPTGTFELQAAIVAAARASGQPVLDAGRGQPNWLATEPRAGVLHARPVRRRRGRSGQRARRSGASRLRRRHRRPARARARRRRVAGRATFLAEAIDYGVDRVRLRPRRLGRTSWCAAVLGAGYPSPTRMLTHVEQVMRALPRHASPARRPARPGTVPGLRHRGRRGGDGLRVPHAAGEPPRRRPATRSPSPRRSSRRTCRSRCSRTSASTSSSWPPRPPPPTASTTTLLEQLLDPAIKAFFVVNPGNPDSRALRPESWPSSATSCPTSGRT